MLVTYFCAFELIKNEKNNDIQFKHAWGSQTTHKRSHPKVRGTTMLMILEAMQMQCCDAMRDLRVKIGVLQIGVLQMPLFKVILAGEVKVKMFVSTR
jgi:hypothetical protein